MWCFWPLIFLAFVCNCNGGRCSQEERRRERFSEDFSDDRSAAERRDFPPMRVYPSEFTRHEDHNRHCD